jgi:nitrite reductase (NADH) small subunit
VSSVIAESLTNGQSPSSPQRELVDGWVTVCTGPRLLVDRGVCALVNGVQVAIFRTSLGELFAVSNRDPISGANVISRGIVGSAASSLGDVSVVTSPMYKQSFDLTTGRCLDDNSFSLSVFEVREHDGAIAIRVP